MPKKKLQRMSLNNDQKENQPFKSRKRKATDQLEEFARTKPSWNIHVPATDQTQRMLREMGLESISQNSTDSSDVIEATPSLYDENSTASFHLPPVPGAPRILLASQRDNITSGSDESSGNDITISTPTSKLVYFPTSGDKQRCSKSKEDNIAYDHFCVLSDEIILCIFRWLPKFVLAKCARVCRRWSRLVLDESLWKRMDLSNKTLKPGILGHVINRGVWALRLAKTEIEEPIFHGIPNEIKCSSRLSKIQYLDLSMAGTTPQILEELFGVCRDLKKVSLENCEVNDRICSYIGENRDLEVLNMAMCQGISANGLIPIGSNCRRLEALHLGWTSLHQHSVVYLCLCLPPSLLKLNLSGCRENITDDEVVQLCKTCPQLRELDLSDSTLLSCRSVLHIASNLPKLEYIALSRCYHIVPLTIQELKNVPTLMAIDIFGMLPKKPLALLRDNMPGVEVNKFPFSSIARPTTGIRRTSVWGIRVRENII